MADSFIKIPKFIRHGSVIMRDELDPTVLVKSHSFRHANKQRLVVSLGQLRDEMTQSNVDRQRAGLIDSSARVRTQDCDCLSVMVTVAGPKPDFAQFARIRTEQRFQ